MWSPSKCSSAYRLSFKWDSGDEDRQFPMTKALLRVYKEVLRRHIPTEQNVTVNISMILNFETDRNSTSSYDEESWVPIKTIQVTRNSNDWLELDVTDQLEAVWDPMLKLGIITIAMKFDVDCKQQTKIPLKIVNPAVEVRNARKERLLRHQPFLVVFINDENVRKAIEENQRFFSDDQILSVSSKNKRDVTKTNGCQLKDFRINFGDLKLNYILSPLVANIKTCTGRCGIQYVRLYPSLGTNYARLMAGAHVHYLSIPEGEKNTSLYADNPKPKEPCCSPIAYNPLMLLTVTRYPVVEQRIFPDFVASRCGCR